MPIDLELLHDITEGNLEKIHAFIDLQARTHQTPLALTMIINTPYFDNQTTLLMAASFYNQPEIASCLLEQGARIDDNALNTALSYGQTDIAKILIEKNAIISMEDEKMAKDQYDAFSHYNPSQAEAFTEIITMIEQKLTGVGQEPISDSIA